ncbi:hypothetical protein ElyMa_002358300 [Elysia marginata]|uniref:Reverse transcriptase zinc-binding domain-containing protein n=1 Tax=Elysia marginata TaxID=1093978 RepID=A0AAV4G8P4_9GAST|nr:hypothetical protein ElyMa_002358300 [Elysia marginata]
MNKPTLNQRKGMFTFGVHREHHLLCKFPNTADLRPFWTGHNRLKTHMYKTYKIGQTNLCPLGEAAKTAEHILHDCQHYRILKHTIWSSPSDLQTKLWETVEELEKTKSFIHQAGINSLSRHRDQEEEED